MARLDRELIDGAVGQGTELGLLASQALFVDQDQTLVREHEEIPKNLEGVLHHLAINQDLPELLLQFLRFYRRRVAEQTVHESHVVLPVCEDTIAEGNQVLSV